VGKGAYEDDVGSFLCDLGSGDTHTETDVGLLESGSIVRSVSGDTDDLSEILKSRDEDLLVFGRRSSKDLKARDDLMKVGFAQLRKADDGSSAQRKGEGTRKGTSLTSRKTGPSMIMPPAV
jgi:hypothetical protein